MQGVIKSYDPSTGDGSVVSDTTLGEFDLAVGPLELGHHGVQRSSHVSARIAVGNRVHVEPVDALGVHFHGVAKGDHCAAQGLRTEPFQSGHDDRLGASGACRRLQLAGSIARLV